MFSKKDLTECAYRELQKRRENYPRWVDERRMQQAVATRQTDMMEAIYRLIIKLDDKVIEDAQK